MSKQLKAAVIGLGNMGRHHARIYYEMSDISLVGVCDPDEKKAEKYAEKYVSKGFASYEHLLEEERPDIVSLTAPTSMHYTLGVDLLKKGVHVLVEKPIAETVVHANEMIQIAKKNNVVLAVGHIERFNPAVQKVKDLITSGVVGEVTSLIGRRVGGFPTQIRDANVVIDLAVHDIDIFNYLLEKKPTEVLSHAGKALIKGRQDHCELFLKYGEQSGFIQVNWITPVRVRNLVVTGTKGYLEADYLTQKVKAYKSHYTTEYDVNGDDVISFKPAEQLVVEVEKKEPLYQELSHFVRVVQGKETLLVSGEVGRDSLAIALEALK